MVLFGTKFQFYNGNIIREDLPIKYTRPDWIETKEKKKRYYLYCLDIVVQCYYLIIHGVSRIRNLNYILIN
uniref:Uncharacterized protein n=1 Tax=Pararge aegeria TaxID=116150 RepID=S4PDF7_9NEOP